MDNTDKSKNDWKTTFCRIIKEHAPFRGKILTVIFLVVTTYVFVAMVPYLIGLIATKVSEGANPREIIVVIGALCFCYLTHVALEKIRYLWEIRNLDLKVSDYHNKNTISHLKTLSIGQHRNQHSLVTISKVSTGEQAMKSFMDMLFYNVLPMLTGVVIAIMATCFFYPHVGLVLVIFGLGIIIHGVIMGKAFVGPMDKYADFNKKVVSKSGGELVRHMDSLKISREEDRHEIFHLRHRRYRRQMYRKLLSSIVIKFIPAQLLSVSGRALAIAVSAYMVYIGRYDIGSIAAIAVWSGQSLGMLQNTQYIFRTLISHWADIVQYHQIMDTKPEIETVGHPVQFNSIVGRVVFDGVCFSYPGTDENSLTAVSFQIDPGQKIGIVGPTGAGKSTLLSLMQIAYLPQLGSVTVDGFDLSNVDQESYRECVGFVEQDPLILSRSLRENLMLGLSDERHESLTDEEIHYVMERLKLEDLIPRLSKGVGEIGKKLSGGQKQRVVIARILLKKPDMLVVDEGTSSVDPITERIIHDALEEVSPGATRIFVAHRLSTVQDSDKIIVLDQGMVVAKGKHEELLERSSLYQDLVSNQLLRV